MVVSTVLFRNVDSSKRQGGITSTAQASNRRHFLAPGRPAHTVNPWCVLTGLPCSAKYPDRLGAAFTPMAQRLRHRMVKPLYLAIHLLVQANQHLWLVYCDDACSDLPMFTIRSNLIALPPWCWQS